MRLIDPTHMRVVHCGQKWPHTTDPCSRECVRFLERNESVISWLQPEGKGIEDQIPCIQIANDRYCALSLRMMKAVWRHVRLKKGFVNEELLLQGGKKLKIPNLLLREKIRTQLRFNVVVPYTPRNRCCIYNPRQTPPPVLPLVHTTDRLCDRSRRFRVGQKKDAKTHTAARAAPRPRQNAPRPGSGTKGPQQPCPGKAAPPAFTAPRPRRHALTTTPRAGASPTWSAPSSSRWPPTRASSRKARGFR